MSVVVNAFADQNGACTLYGRLCTRDGTGVNVIKGEGNCLKQADISTMTWRLRMVSDVPTSIIKGETPMTVSSVIFNTLQKQTDDTAYKGDGKGFNFRFTMPTGYLTQGNRTYEFRVTVVTTGGTQAFAKWLISTLPMD